MGERAGQLGGGEGWSVRWGRGLVSWVGERAGQLGGGEGWSVGWGRGLVS